MAREEKKDQENMAFLALDGLPGVIRVDDRQTRRAHIMIVHWAGSGTCLLVLCEDFHKKNQAHSVLL